MSGERVGPETGAAETFATWDEFEQAYRRQMDAHITSAIEAVNNRRARNRQRWFDCLRSLVVYSCVERGRDWHDGGADYSEGMADMVGLTTVTDSLYAIKEAVFRTGEVSLPELRDVLNRNWSGAEALRQRLLKGVAKFGNDEVDIDAFTVAEMDRINRHIKSHRTVFDGPWGMDVIGWSGAVLFGGRTGATADGRFRGEALADCAGPAQGRNVNGLTATLRSMTKIPNDTIHGPLVLSLRIPSDAVRTPTGIARMRQAAETYMREGGQQLQISIASTEELRHAQREPEKHRDLIVRVGGFSAYFAELDKTFQDDVIARSESVV